MLGSHYHNLRYDWSRRLHRRLDKGYQILTAVEAIVLIVEIFWRLKLFLRSRRLVCNRGKCIISYFQVTKGHHTASNRASKSWLRIRIILARFPLSCDLFWTTRLAICLRWLYGVNPNQSINQSFNEFLYIYLYVYKHTRIPRPASNVSRNGSHDIGNLAFDYKPTHPTRQYYTYVH